MANASAVSKSRQGSGNQWERYRNGSYPAHWAAARMSGPRQAQAVRAAETRQRSHEAALRPQSRAAITRSEWLQLFKDEMIAHDGPMEARCQWGLFDKWEIDHFDGDEIEATILELADSFVTTIVTLGD